ncbi:MAG TPA: xanthine dehydrogenase family protein molybdopterin-binding subunit [Polyangiaceae bacterium]|nr:xanthine dehydrogenase family protein molybdopterin-binding subunit [Polyangiaceae bacterium]
MKTWTGQPLDRVDARLKVTGRAVYSSDVPVANVAHAVIVGSTIGKGRIRSIDVEAARRAAGVLSVIGHDNAPRLAAPAPGTQERGLQMLQDDVVHYDGQPVAVVIADTLEHAQHAAALVAVDYRAEQAVTSMEGEAAHAYAPKQAGRDPADSERGDFDRAFGAAAVRIEQTYTTPREHHNPMEPHATMAVWHGPDRLTLYDATQGVFVVRKRIAQLFGLSPDKVRVISKFLGGGFGCKGSPWSHVALAAMAARVVGRPVKLVLTRHQMFAFVGFRPQTRQKLALGASQDGTLVALRHELLSETSRFDEFVEGSAVVSRMLYACANVRTSHRLVRLDISTPTFTRAPGKATGNYALESAMDELSYALKMDPVALRLKNYAEVDPETGKPWTSKALRACYESAARRFGWERRSTAPRSLREGGVLVGWGMATAAYPAGQSASSAEARLFADGTALVRAGSQDLGTGTYTVMTQVAADALALPIDRVRFELGDTTFAEAPLSAGSRTAASVGSAVKLVCLELRRKLSELAAETPSSALHGTKPDRMDAADGALFDRDDPRRRQSYADILKSAQQKDIAAIIEAKEKAERKNYGTYAFGAQFAEVRVDEAVGEVRVSRMVGAFAAGKVLNAKTARSQLLGGMVWAIGCALEEQTVRDARTGRLVTRDLADYHVPVHADVPVLDVILVEEDDPHVSEVGAKGIGEIGITGGVAAIANAVYHATGKRVRDLPITLDKVLVTS